jgi:hypothetical protein
LTRDLICGTVPTEEVAMSTSSGGTTLTLVALAVLRLAGTSFADPTTAVLTIQKNLTNNNGWGIVNPTATANPTNIWPDKSGIGKTLDAAAANLGSTTFTCTVEYDTDFQFPDVNRTTYLLVTKIKGCHL